MTTYPTYTKQGIARICDCKIRTVEADNQFLIKKGLVTPTVTNGKPNIYSQQDLDIFLQLREHCKANNNRKTFLPNTKTEIVKDNSEVSVYNEKKNLLDNIHIFKEAYREFSYTDPFYDYRLLQLAADKSWYLPSKKLGVIIHKTPESFTNKQRFVYQGFIIDRQPEKEGNSYIWSINANQ